MHSLLDTYLDQVAAHLSALPAKRRNEELREMRQHLQNAVTVNRELGQSEDEAAQNAVMQFGTPEAVGQDTVIAWKRGQELDKRSFCGAAACTLLLFFLVPYLTESLVFRLGMRLTILNPFLWAKVVVDLLSWGLPTWFLVGAISGLAFPKRAVSGTSFMMAIWLALILAHYIMPDQIGAPYHSQRWHTIMYERPLQNVILMVLVNFGQFVVLALVAAFGAKVSSRWRLRRTALRLAGARSGTIP